MAVKIMGITAGRHDGNSEILLKQSLLACQEAGAEVTLVNLRDFKILDCTGCTACSEGMARGKRVPCVLKAQDDKDKITEEMLKQDGVIFSAPTYDLFPSANYLRFAQRNLAYETAFLQAIGAIEKKDRVAGLIAVGGSMDSWQSIAMPAMQATTFTNSFLVVDMILAKRVPSAAQCLLNDELMERAYQMGANIMTAIHTPVEQRKWLGDEDEGWCPNCHSSALVLGHKQWDGVHWPIECQVCGAGGDLEKTEDGKWKFVIAEDGLSRDRTTDEGREFHLKEIGATHGLFYIPENQMLIKEKIKKFKELKFPGLK
ncbi:flavodoxin family protein [Anoxybacterium hadale]|uniref:Flavodoxin family protein n=1 Tax=Anoxybacterium hadale TaxID=3408580 RepID=A0ACD1AFC8_9FIRM|nr:flavodoxin family protein [Clostridiales bacterium]